MDSTVSGYIKYTLFRGYKTSKYILILNRYNYVLYLFYMKIICKLNLA